MSLADMSLSELAAHLNQRLEQRGVRITSYNVCYTKLLRVNIEPHIARQVVEIEQQMFVIFVALFDRF